MAVRYYNTSLLSFWRLTMRLIQIDEHSLAKSLDEYGFHFTYASDGNVRVHPQLRKLPDAPKESKCYYPKGHLPKALDYIAFGKCEELSRIIHVEDYKFWSQSGGYFHKSHFESGIAKVLRPGYSLVANPQPVTEIEHLTECLDTPECDVCGHITV